MKVTQKTQNQPQQQIDDEVFASCSFSSLGLQPSLCDQLKGFSLFFLFSIFIYNSLIFWYLILINPPLTERLGFEGPTQVQAQAIPVILSGRHVYPSFPFSIFRLIWFLIKWVVFLLWFSLMGVIVNRLVNAVTGSGKTVAYLAPIIHHLQKYEPRIQRTDGTFGMWCFCCLFECWIFGCFVFNVVKIETWCSMIFIDFHGFLVLIGQNYLSVVQ